MTSQSLNPYRSIRISRMMYVLGKFIYESPYNALRLI